MIKFRNLEKKDIEDVRALALKSWKFAYKKIYKTTTAKRMVSSYYSDENFEKEMKSVKKGNAKFILALDSKKLIGYVHAAKIKRKWEVIRIYIDPTYTRKGIGTKLLHKIEIFLKKKNVKKYTISPHVKNKLAINFYKKLGFKREPKYDSAWNSPCYIKEI